MEGSNAYMLTFDMQLPEESEKKSFFATRANVSSGHVQSAGMTTLAV